MCIMAINQQFNGIELTFESKPSAAIREAMKAAGFRWHGMKKLWYAKNTEARMELARKLSGTPDVENSPVNPTRVASTASAPKNRYGVKVGDVFVDSWGYEQTNIDFYQVVALRGTTQIVLKPIKKNYVAEGSMCGHSTPVRDSFFDLDQYKTRFVGRGEETIRKTVKNYGTDENPNIYAGELYKTTWDAEHYESSYY